MTTNLFIRIGTYEKYNEAMEFFDARGFTWASGGKLNVVKEENRGNIDFDKWLIHKSETMFNVNVLKKTIALTELNLIQKYKLGGDWVMNLSTFDKKYKQVIKELKKDN